MAGRILVIEDEPGIVDFLERGLRSHGFVVESAADGVRGSERAISEPFALVVLDWMPCPAMPATIGIIILACGSIAATFRWLASNNLSSASGPVRLFLLSVKCLCSSAVRQAR